MTDQRRDQRRDLAPVPPVPAGEGRHRTGPHRSRLEREAHYCEIARLHRLGLTGRQIAERLGLAPSTVSADLREVRRRYAEREHQHIAEAIGEQLAHQADVRREAWAAWEASKERPRRSTRTTTDAAGRRVTVTTEGSLPDPRYLMAVLATLEDERQLLGLDGIDAAGLLSPEDGAAIADAVMRAAAEELRDPAAVARARDRALTLLPRSLAGKEPAEEAAWEQTGDEPTGPPADDSGDQLGEAAGELAEATPEPERPGGVTPMPPGATAGEEVTP